MLQEVSSVFQHTASLHIEDLLDGIAGGRRSRFVFVAFFPMFVDFAIDFTDDGAFESDTLLVFAGRTQHGGETESKQDRNEDFPQFGVEQRTDLHVEKKETEAHSCLRCI